MTDLAKLETALRNADAAGDTEAATILAGEIVKARADSYKPEPAGVGKRMAYGMAEPIVGLGQLASRGLAAAGNLLPESGARDYLTSLPERNDAAAMAYAQKQREMAPEGIDWARLGGQAITLAPAALVGAAPAATMGQIAGRSALLGGLTGATGIVEDPSQYGVSKTLRTGAGAAMGAVAGPVVAKASDAIGKGLSMAAGALRPKMGIPQIQIKIENALTQNGVDLSQLPKTYTAELARDVSKALKAGGTLDEATLRNIAQARTLGMDLTRGQATQNAPQFGTELFLRQAPGGEDLAAQYAGSLSMLNQNLTNMQRNMPQAIKDIDAGRVAMSALKAADEPAKKRVDQLYTLAKANAGVDAPLDGRPFVDKTLGQLEKELVLSNVPGDVRNMLNMVSTGKGQLTIGRAQEVIQSINGLLSNLPVRDPQRVALNIVKRNLDDAVDKAGGNLPGQAGEAFRRAREAAAKRFQKIDKIPALRQILDDEIAPDDFMRKHVYGAKIDDLKAMRAFLRSNSRPAWNQIRAQVLNDLKLAATKGSEEPTAFSQAAFNRELQSLKSDGRLGLMFSPSEISKLEAVGRVGRLVQLGPADVPRTGLLGSAKAMGMLMNVISKVPGVSQTAGFVQGAAQRGGNTLQATVAMQQPKLAAIPNAIPEGTRNRLATLAATMPAVAIQE